MYRIYPLYTALILWSCGSIHSGKTRGNLTPMVDGTIEDFVEMQIIPIVISENVNLYIHQNAQYVWFGYTYPEGSFGTLDMLITSQNIPDTLNLHVSAQIGEWYSNQPETIPNSPESENWWNMKGWIANPVWINGKDTTNDQVKFKNSPAREIQMSKLRFGTGLWKIKFKIKLIKTYNGEFSNLSYPKDDTFYSLYSY
ncbi:MAG: hypothetical protein H6598_09835 [Flavobacteriales bacterium]|nr:hypothetical protein [Flavobacteriales bacterium]